MSDEAIITNAPAPEPATPAITEQQAQAMPLNELKAVIEGKQPTQEPRVIAPQDPSQRPNYAEQAAPPAAEWGRVEKQPDGTYHVKLASGEIFKGTAEQLLEIQAKAQYATKKWAHEIRDQYEKFHQKPDEPVNMPAEPQQMTPEEQAQAILEQQNRERAYLAQLVTPEMAQALVAQALGVTPEALPQVIDQVWANNSDFAHQRAYMDFVTACPEYEDTPENAEALVGAMPNFPQGYIPTGLDMQRAWAIALYEGKGRPAVKREPIPPAPRPPVMPTSGASATHGEVDPYKMDINQLRDIVKRNGG